jgi:hypothetical protein
MLSKVNAFKSERFQFGVNVLTINLLNFELTMPTYGSGVTLLSFPTGKKKLTTFSL